MNGNNLRLEKLFSKGENAVIVAIDHDMFDGLIPGMINLKETAQKINPCVDGVLLSPGMLKHLRNYIITTNPNSTSKPNYKPNFL